jgi:hypothetical protein
MTKTDDQTAIHVHDLKGPLKGKGGTLAQWRREADKQLRDIWAAMDELALECSTIVGRTFGLKVYPVRDGRQLRWRLTSGRHATWDRVEPLLVSLAPGLAQWYQQAQEVAQILNHREQVARYELKTVDRLINGSSRQPRPYRGEVGRGAGGGRKRELDREDDLFSPERTGDSISGN